MKKPLDRITEAYFGELGDTFSEKVRNRIHWVCENAKGETILDVGCSQGITSILLGREGKHVLGIDLLNESIEFANTSLLKEEEATKSFVEFKAVNFMQYDFENRVFDSIILGEVLEHITDPKRFLAKANSLLNANGSIIITLPFGLNDYFDHKKTYYLLDLLGFANEELVVQEIKFFGKWIGAILKKKGEESSQVTLNEELVKRLEQDFLTIEKEMLQKVRARDVKLAKFEEKIETLTATQIKQKKLLVEHEKTINSLKSLVEKNLNESNETMVNSFKLELSEKEQELFEVNESKRRLEVKIKEQEDKSKAAKLKEEQLKSEILELKRQAILFKKEKLKVEKDLYSAYEKEERLLKTHNALLNKYKALSNSKLGKITLSYWKKRRKAFGGK